MCGRYYIAQDAENEMLADIIRQAQERADRAGLSMTASGEIRPTNIAPVIATSAVKRTIGAYPMRWGFTHPTRKLLVFNTRSETAAEKPLFSDSMTNRRCLIPASGYFEWKKLEDGNKQKYAFTSMDGSPLFLAGLYLRNDDMKLPCFTILTQDATDSIKGIHARMPVILTSDQAELWFSPEDDYKQLIKNITPNIKAVVA